MGTAGAPRGTGKDPGRHRGWVRIVRESRSQNRHAPVGINGAVASRPCPYYLHAGMEQKGMKKERDVGEGYGILQTRADKPG